MHMDHCPASYSPRLGDPAYRTTLLDYMAEQYTLMVFEKNIYDLYKKLNKAIQKIEWKIAPAGYQVESKSFWRLFETFQDHTEQLLALSEKNGLLDQHPDQPTRELTGILSNSIFAEGWLPYLSKEDAARLLKTADLEGEYIEAPPVDLRNRRCGQCGGDLPTAEGASRVLCENCGFLLDVAGSEIPCDSCGSSFSLPEGSAHVNCPYCESEVRRV